MYEIFAVFFESVYFDCFDNFFLNHYLLYEKGEIYQFQAC